MRMKTWPVAALGLGSLLVLIVVSMLASSRRAEEIYTQLDQLNSHHRKVDDMLRRLRSDVNLSGIFVRDYLLDVARERAPEYRERLAEFRRNNMATIAELRSVVGQDDRLTSLQAKLDDYWETFDPLFDWTPAEKILRSAGFLRREVVPRREAVLTIAQEIEELNNANISAQRGEVSRRQTAFRGDQYRLLWRSVLFGAVVALVFVLRLRVLERRSEEQRAMTEGAERRMRELSQRLVAAQEEERKNLSRELHDHVAQVLTGLRMELGRIERTTAPVDVRIGPAVVECKKLVDQMFQTVRNLALGLRPSMLDDLGLQPALEWHVRDVAGRYGVDIELDASGDLDALPEAYRTCIYRAIQEALTNCIRHAHATRIAVTVTVENSGLRIRVADDGVGIDPARRRDGLGLRGIEERVKELRGGLTIARGAEQGTTLDIRLPIPSRETEGSLARAAG